MVQSVADFYAGQKILVTGGTGFMGKVLIEKLLRSCPDVDTIYVIIRSKKGKSIEERWRDITKLPLFDKLKSMRPENLKKVELISGDLIRDDLGLSNEDKQVLVNNVRIVFYMAADVQFTESINKVLEQNVKATKTFLDFMTTFKKLKVFLYVSTAYCNFDRPPSESVEKILPALQDWRHLLKLQETQPQVLQILKEKLLCGHSIPYTWSKSLAEQVVNEYSIFFPTVVFRPAIVLGCINDDPLKGWTDALNGMSALAVGGYIGVVRILKTNNDYFNDYVPVDIASRAQLVAAKKAVEQGTKLEVYNCATAAVSPVTMGDMKKYVIEMEEIYPIQQKIWKTSVLYTTNPFFYYIMFIIRQVLPSLFLDLCLKLAGHEQMFTKISIKVAKANKIFTKITTTKNIFPIDNYKMLKDYLCEDDRRNFSMDVDMSGAKVFMQMSIGICKYFFKLDLSEEALNKNRKRFERILLIRKIVKTVQYSIYALLIWILLDSLL